MKRDQRDKEAAALYPWFIGAHAENHEVFEQLLLEFLHDHMYWRRNFHPADPPPIPTSSPNAPEYQAFVARLKQELLALGASLKNSVPLFSPRYLGHMLCDPLMPGLLAQMITLPYNPNNVSEEAAPVTVGLEVEVGLQLARMLGLPCDTARTPCAFGHLTSGGTVANYEALWVLRALKYFPLALQAAFRRLRVPVPEDSPLAVLDSADGCRLVNLSVAETVELREAYLRFVAAAPEPGFRQRLVRAVQAERLENLGMHLFFYRHRGCAPPAILVPATAHYSWDKAMKLLGIGTESLIKVPVHGMRMDMDALERTLAAAHKAGQPVLCVVGVLGTTEYGTLDPVHEIVKARERWLARGLGFAVHVDAAWGGYLATLFRRPDGTMSRRADVAARFSHFPSERVYATFGALGAADSITVDPHKLGYLPYGVGGAYVCRDSRCMDFVAEDPPYLGAAPSVAAEADYRTRFRRLGRYVLEGSKPGSAAAAAYVTHKVLPLDSAHFGRLARASVTAAEYFCDRLNALAGRISPQVRVVIPVEPDSNLVCVAFNPVGNRSAAAMNAFTAAVFGHLRVNREVPLQAHAFFSSSTVLYRRMLSSADRRRLLLALGIDSTTLRETVEAPEHQADGLMVLRHTLMNPWLRDTANGVDYVEMYCRYLEEVLRLEVQRGPFDQSRNTNVA